MSRPDPTLALYTFAKEKVPTYEPTFFQVMGSLQHSKD